METEQVAEIPKSGCGTAPRLDRETCKAFRVTPEESEALVAYVCRILAGVLENQTSVDILGFGSFRVKAYRPIRPGPEARESVVEAPYLGPVEFSPSPLLIRQLRSGALERSLVPRSDLLYSALRKDNQVPRGQIPHLIKAVFRALTAALIQNALVSLPGIGCLVVRRRPPTVRYNVETETVEAVAGPPDLYLRSSIPFLVRVLSGRHAPRAGAQEPA